MKTLGTVLRIFSYLLTVAAFTVPTALLAYHFSGDAVPRMSETVMAFLMCVIAVFVAVCVPIRRLRALWGGLFGGIVYAGLAYLCLFGFARMTTETVMLFAPFRVDWPPRINSFLLYGGAGVFAAAIALAAGGRALQRRASENDPVVPRIRATADETPRVLDAPALQNAATAEHRLSPSAPARYVRDEKGNLVARRDVTPPSDRPPAR